MDRLTIPSTRIEDAIEDKLEVSENGLGRQSLSATSSQLVITPVKRTPEKSFDVGETEETSNTSITDIENKILNSNAPTSTPNVSSNITSFTDDDPENPKNWSKNRKLLATFLISTICFFTPATSSMVAPALERIASDLDIPTSSEQQLVLSIFVLGLGIGPLVLGPLSETYGRAPVIRYGNLFYLIFNTAGGFARSKSEMFAFRLLAGAGGSAPLVVSSPVIHWSLTR